MGNLFASTAKRDVLLVISVGVVLWLFLTLGWGFLTQIDGLRAEGSRWNDLSGSPGWSWRLPMCLLLVGCLYLAQRTRHVSSYGAAAVIGLLVAVVGVPFTISYGSSIGAEQFVLWRGAILTAGIMLASSLLFGVRSRGLTT